MPERSDDRPHRTRRLLCRPAVLVPAVAVVLTGASTAAASDWLDVLQSNGQETTSTGMTELVGLAAFGAAGNLVVSGQPDVHEVPDASAASAETGLPVPIVASLPRGVSGEPTYLVGGKVDVASTYSTEPATPGDAHVRVQAGPGVAAVWSRPSGIPQLIVARTVTPTVSSSNVSLESMRDHLLSLPGVAEEGSTSTTVVNGVPALLFATNDASLSGVAWVVDGTVTVVAGTLDRTEILSVATNLTET